MYDLFSSGRIFLIREPVNGNSGSSSLYAKVCCGNWSLEYDPTKMEEAYFVFTTKNRRTLLILHIDQAGIDITKRKLFANTFQILLDEKCEKEVITREQLKRLVLDGTYRGEWKSVYLERMMNNFMQATPLPQTQKLVERSSDNPNQSRSQCEL